MLCETVLVIINEQLFDEHCTCSPAVQHVALLGACSCAVSCRPGLQYISGDRWAPRCHWWSPALARTTLPVLFPKSTYMFKEAMSHWLSVESFLLKDLHTRCQQLWEYMCIGKIVELYFENILCSVQPGDRKRGTDVCIEVFRQNTMSPLSWIASLAVFVSCVGNTGAPVMMFLLSFYSYSFFVNTFPPRMNSL